MNDDGLDDQKASAPAGSTVTGAASIGLDSITYAGLIGQTPPVQRIGIRPNWQMTGDGGTQAMARRSTSEHTGVHRNPESTLSGAYCSLTRAINGGHGANEASHSNALLLRSTLHCGEVNTPPRAATS